jgi:hypothetical protein
VRRRRRTEDRLHEALDLLQLLGGMAVVEAGVGPLEQLGHARPHVGRQPVGCRAAAQPVQETARARGAEPHLTPLKLSNAQVHRQGALRIDDLPGQGRLEQPGPRHFLSTHRECLPCRHGVTFSLNSYGVTFS